MCIALKADWFQGYRRKGLALQSSGKIEEAKAAYQEGLKVDPNNQTLKDHLESIDTPENPFFGPEALGKLMTNERTRAYFMNPDFKNKWEMCKMNPQFMMQIMQTDPRFMDVF